MENFAISQKNLERIAATDFIVDVGGEDVQNMWFQWNTVLNLIQHSDGMMLEIGQVGGHPVVVAVSWYTIEGKLVAFVEGSSRVVDYSMIDKWCQGTFPILKGRHSKTNMTNFHNCLRSIAPNWSDDAKKLAQFKRIQNVCTGAK